MSFQLTLSAPIEGHRASQVSTDSETEVQLSQEQSLCLIKVFLNASLGCICFARGLIPSDSPTYQDRRVDDLILIPLTSSPTSYHDFLSFQGQLSVNNESQPFKILVRGKDKRADHILNLVESGVFEAVDRGYLEAVQFSLSCDSSRRQEVIECYTFFFSYTDCEDSGRQVRSVKVSSAAEGHFYVAGAQKSFRKAIRNLLVLCQQLPALPRRRNLGVNLLYNPSCPVQYEPPGFAGSPDTNTCSFVDTSTATDDVGKFHVGYYEIAVAASHATLADNNAAQRSQVPQIINQRDSTRDPTTCCLEDITTRRQLQAMQRSSSVPSNLISTQMECAPRCTQTASQADFSAVIIKSPGSGIIVDLSSRRQRNVAPTKMAELIVQAWGIEGHNQSYMYVMDLDHLRKNKIKRLNPGATISCDCGSDHKEDAMTLCELCGLWQHNICYGLQRYRPEKKPNEHFCYSCLLLPSAEHVNDGMPALVRMRLALTHLYDHEVQVIGRESLVKSLHLAAEDQTTYLKLFAELEHQGFIQKSSTNGVFAVVEEQKVVTYARSNYLDPLAHISDYYVAVKDKDTAQDRAKAIQEALDGYTDGRSLDMWEDASELDKWLCENAFGRPIVRWGFYSERNEAARQHEVRKRVASPAFGPGIKKPRTGRKMSISKTMINLDLPSEECNEIEDGDTSTNDNASTA